MTSTLFCILLNGETSTIPVMLDEAQSQTVGELRKNAVKAENQELALFSAAHQCRRI